DEAAKKRAINLALMEFDAVQEALASENPTDANTTAPQKKSSWRQGFLRWLRPMGTHNPNRTPSMNDQRLNFPQKKFLISGLATCSLAVVGVLLLQNMPHY